MDQFWAPFLANSRELVKGFLIFLNIKAKKKQFRQFGSMASSIIFHSENRHIYLASAF